MHYFYGKSNQGHGICPLYRGCLPLGESVIRGFTVYSAVNAIMRLLQFLCASGVDFILLYSLVKKAIKKKLEERKAGPSSSGSAAKSVSKQPPSTATSSKSTVAKGTSSSSASSKEQSADKKV